MPRASQPRCTGWPTAGHPADGGDGHRVGSGQPALERLRQPASNPPRQRSLATVVLFQRALFVALAQIGAYCAFFIVLSGMPGSPAVPLSPNRPLRGILPGAAPAANTGGSALDARHQSPSSAFASSRRSCTLLRAHVHGRGPRAAGAEAGCGQSPGRRKASQKPAATVGAGAPQGVELSRSRPPPDAQKHRLCTSIGSSVTYRAGRGDGLAGRRSTGRAAATPPARARPPAPPGLWMTRTPPAACAASTAAHPPAARSRARLLIPAAGGERGASPALPPDCPTSTMVAIDSDSGSM